MSTLKVNKIIPTAGVPTGGGGGITQVKQTVKKDVTSQSSTSTSTFNDISGLSVTITPTSSTNKILVRFCVQMSTNYENSNGHIRLLKDGNTISDFTGSDGTVSNGAMFTRMGSKWELGDFNNEFLDTAGTTSTISYQLQWSTEDGRTIYLNRRGGSAEYGAVSYITAMEVSA